MMQVTNLGTAAREEDANVAESGKQRGGRLAGVSLSSLREVHGDKLSLLSRVGQPLLTPQHQTGDACQPLLLMSCASSVC